jgi:hypothetical protein
MPTTGNLSYESKSITTQLISLETELKISQVDGTKNRLEYWVNLDKDAQPQIETVTISDPLPTADCFYRVAIDSPGSTSDRSYLVEMMTSTVGLTAAKIASLIAEVVDTNAAVSAAATGDMVVITAVEPGTTGAFTVSVSCINRSTGADISNKISTSTTQAASGTARFRKIAKLDIMLASSLDLTPELRVVDGIWFDGTVNAAEYGRFGPIPFTGPIAIDKLRSIS